MSGRPSETAFKDTPTYLLILAIPASSPFLLVEEIFKGREEAGPLNDRDLTL